MAKANEHECIVMNNEDIEVIVIKKNSNSDREAAEIARQLINEYISE